MDTFVGAAALASFCVIAGTALFLLVGLGGRLLLGALPYGLALGFRAWSGPNRSGHAVSPAEKLFFLGLAAFSGLALAWGAGVPAFHYDGLLYHLPAAALAWQERSLFLFTAHPQIGANPIFAELPKVWSYAFSGDDSLAALQQLPNLLGVAALAFSLARRFGAPGIFCVLAGLATLLIPKAAEQALSANVDLLAGFWTAVCADLLARRRNGPAAAALVVLAQLKYTTLLPAAAGALWLGRRISRPRPYAAAGFLLVFLFLGGLSEWRNLARYGNPTAPYQLLSGGGFASLLSRTAPHAVVNPRDADPSKWQGYYWNGIDAAAGTGGTSGPLRFFEAWGDAVAVPYDRAGGRWGPAWFVLAVPCLVLAIAMQALRSRRKRRVTPALASLLFALGGYFLTVKSWETRFGFALVPFGFAAAAWLLAFTWPPKLRAVPAAAFCALLVWSAEQIYQSHPYPALRAHPALSALALATRDPGEPAVEELALHLKTLAPPSLWIDFTYGERHEYGMPYTLLYPYFSRRWDRSVTIASSAAGGTLERIRAAAPAAVLLQPGSRIAPAELGEIGYRQVWQNDAGVILAKP